MRWPTLIALAMALGICGWVSAHADASQTADLPSTASTTDFASTTALPDDWFENTPPAAPSKTNSTQPATDPPDLRAEGATPVAPLPPAIFMGPLGIGLVALASYRLRKKGI